MAIPRGYRRNSSGFVQPIGGGPSAARATSGQGHFTGNQLSREQKESLLSMAKASGLDDLESRAIAYGSVGSDADTKWKATRKKMMERYKSRQADHDKVMAGITKRDADTFKRLNDALTASREVDAKNKDKLGNAMPPSQQTEYLQSQLRNHMAAGYQRGQQASSASAAGVTPEQEKTFKEQGPYIEGMPGTSDLLNRGPVGQATPTPMPGPGNLEPGDATTRVPLPGGRSLQAPPKPPEVFPMNTKVTHKSGVEITLLGQQRMGPNGPEYLARTEDGREDWVPRSSFEVPETAGKGEGLKALEKYLSPKYQEDPDAYVT
jgi:hypothetical protein